MTLNTNVMIKQTKRNLVALRMKPDGKAITNFIALKPKSYCFKIHNESKEEKKSKGIVKHKVKSELSLS